MCPVKAFLRPCFEYGAPMLWHLSPWASSRVVPVGSVWADLQALHRDVVAWATGTNPRQNKAASALADLPLPRHRFFALSVTFLDHLEGTHQLNPVRTAFEHISASKPHLS